MEKYRIFTAGLVIGDGDGIVDVCGDTEGSHSVRGAGDIGDDGEGDDGGGGDDGGSGCDGGIGGDVGSVGRQFYRLYLYASSL